MFQLKKKTFASLETLWVQYVKTQREEENNKEFVHWHAIYYTPYTTHHTKAMHCVFGVNKHRLQNCFTIQIIKQRENSFVFNLTHLSLKHFPSSDVHVANTIPTGTEASHFPAHSFFLLCNTSLSSISAACRTLSSLWFPAVLLPATDTVTLWLLCCCRADDR